ncbi:MAG: hypothetical protein J0H60_16860 [Rhizobiales bacterium]|nr:hypothetical protein [Hyphomicrobiales bacterium]
MSPSKSGSFQPGKAKRDKALIFFWGHHEIDTFATVALVASTTGAMSAGTFATPASSSAPVVAVHDWAGSYIGVLGGGTYDRYRIYDQYGGTYRSFSGPALGIFGGYNWQSSNLVYGFDGSIGYRFGKSTIQMNGPLHAALGPMRVGARTKVPHPFAVIRTNLAWRSRLKRPPQRPGRLGSHPSPQAIGLSQKAHRCDNARKAPPPSGSGADDMSFRLGPAKAAFLPFAALLP